MVSKVTNLLQLIKMNIYFSFKNDQWLTKLNNYYRMTLLHVQRVMQSEEAACSVDAVKTFNNCSQTYNLIVIIEQPNIDQYFNQSLNASTMGYILEDF